MTNAATLSEITDFARDIRNHWRGNYPMTIEQAGRAIEAELDGTQPADLIPQAIAMAARWIADNE